MSDTTYIADVVARVNEVTADCGPIFIYGENINFGSCIGGLARGLKVNEAGVIQNVGNCELTHVGLGLGMLLDGGQGILFGKQLDFMLLGIEQMCDTFNFIRAFRPRHTWGSFTILVAVSDQGYQGPQSSLNAASDFASLANIPVYCLNGADDVRRVIGRHLVSPGFRILCVSQRQFGSPVLTAGADWMADDDSIFRYRSGSDATIVSYNFSLRDALQIDDRVRAAGKTTELFHVNFIPGMDIKPIMDSCRRTGKLVIVDDSKTVTKFGDSLVAQLAERGLSVPMIAFWRRGCDEHGYGANEDRFAPDFEKSLAFVMGEGYHPADSNQSSVTAK